MTSRTILILLSVIGTSIAVSSIHYKVKTCIVADLNATVTIANLTNPLENVAGSKGSCSSKEDVSNILVDLAGESGSLEFTLGRTSDGVYLQAIDVRYKGSQATKKLNERLSNNDTFFECSLPKTFSGFSTSTSAVNVTIRYIKIQAFMVKNGTYTGQGTNCVLPETTVVPPGTTTVPDVTTTVPDVTTTVPDVTTTVPDVTTTVPDVTTTSSGAGSSSTRPSNSTTTPQSVTTFSPPQSKNVTLAYSEKGIYCVVVTLKGTIEVKDPKGKNAEIYHIAQTARINGNCGESNQYVNATLPNKWMVALAFAKSSKKVGRRLLADVTYHLSEVLIKYNDKGKSMSELISFKDRYQVNVGQSYRCKSSDSFDGKHVKLSVEDFQAEAFRTSNTTKFSSSVECSADSHSKNNTVPIVVGVCLGVLVIIIIVAYLIGRRRQREQNSYSSMN